MSEIDNLNLRFDWMFELMLENYDLKRRLINLERYNTNLREKLKELKEPELEPMPYNLDEIFVEK